MPRSRRSRRKANARPRQRNATQGSADPPAYQQVPWYKAWLSFHFSDFKVPGAINVRYVINQIRTQVLRSASANQNVEFRMLQARFYELSGNPIAVAIGNLVTTMNDQTARFTPFKILEDWPARNKWAHVHFRYPRALRDFNNYVMGSADSFTGPDVCTMYPVANATTGSLLVYFHVLWRVAVGTQPQLPGFETRPSEFPPLPEPALPEVFARLKLGPSASDDRNQQKSNGWEEFEMVKNDTHVQPIIVDTFESAYEILTTQPKEGSGDEWLKVTLACMNKVVHKLRCGTCGSRAISRFIRSITCYRCDSTHDALECLEAPAK